MGNINDTTIVLGSLRFKGAPDTDTSVRVPLNQNMKEIVEYDRTMDIGLEQVFDNERQASDVMRPTAKFSIIFKNSYSGFTNYPPFENNLYYLNAATAAAAQCEGNAQSVSWTGLPQYNEFDFIRNDYNVSGYTQPPNEHLIFSPISASSYNWNFFVSYAFENDYNKILQAYDNKSGTYLNWVVGDGIPFIIENTTYNGRDIISFRCPIKHGLSTGEYVKLSFDYNGNDLFQIYSLGAETYGSGEYVFSIINVGYTGTTFNNGVTGTAKRVVNNENETDTISEYYVRRHKILTNPQDAVMGKAGFEQSIFGTVKKYESSGFTPNGVARVSIKEGSQSYTLSFNTDIKTNPLIDNQKRPITELFFTVLWKGYFGWTIGTDNFSPKQMKQGYEFNLPLVTDQITNISNPSNWWDDANSYSNTDFSIGAYTTTEGASLGLNGGPLIFTYVESFSSGDTLDGAVCEWNDYEQNERVISEIYHKIKYNNYVFTTGDNLTNPRGYYYKPHYSLPTRVYSDYIENGNPQDVENIPNYSYFSTTLNTFIWRDLYPYGFIDSSGLGISYPFLNGAHYPYSDYFFRIIPEGTNYIDEINQIIAQPITDDCE